MDNVVVEVEPGDLIPTSSNKGAGPGTRAAYPWRVGGPRGTRPLPPPAGREEEKSLPHHPKKGGRRLSNKNGTKQIFRILDFF